MEYEAISTANFHTIYKQSQFAISPLLTLLFILSFHEVTSTYSHLSLQHGEGKYHGARSGGKKPKNNGNRWRNVGQTLRDKPKPLGHAQNMREVNKAIVQHPNGQLAIEDELKRILMASADQPNRVARMLVSKLFTVPERVNSNCTGTRGQNRMDPIRLQLLRSTVFEVCGIDPAEEEEAWRHIRTAVDASNRSLRFAHNRTPHKD